MRELQFPSDNLILILAKSRKNLNRRYLASAYDLIVSSSARGERSTFPAINLPCPPFNLPHLHHAEIAWAVLM
jgi:hypothetical protein